MARMRRGILDIVLLIGSAILIICLGLGAVALKEKFQFGEFWIWGTWFGILSFISMAGFLRSKFRQRGFIVLCAAWFPIHMFVMFISAARLPMVISIVPVTLELFIGLTIAYVLFGPPQKHGK